MEEQTNKNSKSTVNTMTTMASRHKTQPPPPPQRWWRRRQRRRQLTTTTTVDNNDECVASKSTITTTTMTMKGVANRPPPPPPPPPPRRWHMANKTASATSQRDQPAQLTSKRDRPASATDQQARLASATSKRDRPASAISQRHQQAPPPPASATASTFSGIINKCLLLALNLCNDYLYTFIIIKNSGIFQKVFRSGSEVVPKSVPEFLRKGSIFLWRSGTPEPEHTRRWAWIFSEWIAGTSSNRFWIFIFYRANPYC